jgi:branched-chain amino acid transport system substrate-binding protein
MRRSPRLTLALAALAAVVALAAAGCGGGGQATIKIGVIGDCQGGFANLYEQTIAGAELPLIERGANLRGAKPSDGVTEASVGGKRVQLLLGCEDYGSPRTTLAQARRLVEQEGADVVVAPLWYSDGLIVREYAQRQPAVVFLATSLEPQTTLQRPQPNIFRFTLDAPQSIAGLGSYAYHRLGWRNVVTFGQGDPSGWPLVAGFVAEFCSLGGNVVKRVWASSLLTDWHAAIAQMPEKGVDGVLMASSLQNPSGFFRLYARLHPDLARRVVASGLAFDFTNPLLPSMVGVVGAEQVPYVTTALAWNRYVQSFKKAFPMRGLYGPGLVDLVYHNATEAALEALAHDKGDLSHGERKLKAALAALQLDAPNGRIHLDEDRQAVGSTLLSRVEKDAHGHLVIRTFRSVPGVEQTFNGYFSATTPAPSPTAPTCKHGNPPAWARSG